MRPLYPRSDFAADPGLVPDTENHKTPHPDAPTAPRTADTGATDPINAPGAAPSMTDSYIASLLAPAKGLAGLTGALPVQFQNPVGINPFLHTAPPLSGGQIFLRNLVGGYNSQAGFDASNPKNASALASLMRVQQAAAMSPYHAANIESMIGGRTFRQTLQTQQNDPSVIGSQAWARAKGLDPTSPGSPAWMREASHDIQAKNAATAAGSLAERRRHDVVTEGLAKTRIALGGAGGGAGPEPFVPQSQVISSTAQLMRDSISGSQLSDADKAQRINAVNQWESLNAKQIRENEAGARAQRRGLVAPPAAAPAAPAGPSTLDILNGE